jgi:hypothetical protein
MLTETKKNAAKAAQNNSSGVSRTNDSGIFYVQSTLSREAVGSKTPVSAYRKVCGKRPLRLVCNTGAFLLQRESRPSVIARKRSAVAESTGIKWI